MFFYLNLWGIMKKNNYGNLCKGILWKDVQLKEIAPFTLAGLLIQVLSTLSYSGNF